MSFDEWKKDCAVEEQTLEKIETVNLYPDDGRVPHVPFGLRNADWLRFKSKTQPGDTLYFYSTSPESWEHLAGRAGYVLVRGGEVVDTFNTMMN